MLDCWLLRNHLALKRSRGYLGTSKKRHQRSSFPSQLPRRQDRLDIRELWSDPPHSRRRKKVATASHAHTRTALGTHLPEQKIGMGRGKPEHGTPHRGRRRHLGEPSFE